MVRNRVYLALEAHRVRKGSRPYAMLDIMPSQGLLAALSALTVLNLLLDPAAADPMPVVMGPTFLQ